MEPLGRDDRAAAGDGRMEAACARGHQGDRVVDGSAIGAD
jgi:hypothetical protein